MALAVREIWGKAAASELSRAQDEVAGDRQQHEEGKDAYRSKSGKARALAVRRFHEDQCCALTLKPP